MGIQEGAQQAGDGEARGEEASSNKGSPPVSPSYSFDQNDEPAWSENLLTSLVGEPQYSQNPIRRFYADYFGHVDKLDRCIYELQFPYKVLCSFIRINSLSAQEPSDDHCYVWSLMLTAVVTARAVYCERRDEREDCKTFGLRLCEEIIAAGLCCPAP